MTEKDLNKTTVPLTPQANYVSTTTCGSGCNHIVDVKMVNGNYVSYCTKCGAILDTKCAWHY